MAEGREELLRRISELEARLEETEATLSAIRQGEVDAVVVSGTAGDQVYALRGADEAYRLMVEVMTEGAMTVTPEGVILYANEQLAAMLDVPHARIIGSDLRQYVAPTDREALSILLESAMKGPAKRELRLLRRDGLDFPGYLSANGLRLDAVACVCLVVMDLTEHRYIQRIAELYQQAHREIQQRLQVENELRRSNQDLSQFASVISHDLRSPLNAITSFAWQLKEEYGEKLGPEAAPYVSYLIGAAERMRSLIADLLAYSRVALSGVVVNELVETEEAFRRALLNLEENIRDSGVNITHDPLPEVQAAGALLTQVFQNLLENAIKFRTGAAPWIHVAAKRDGQQWIFCVSDNGIGIAPEHKENVFQIFKKLHGDEHQGSGIGLAICRTIVERHGGRIWVESAPGQGSEFYFTLPAPGSPALGEADAGHLRASGSPATLG